MLSVGWVLCTHLKRQAVGNVSIVRPELLEGKMQVETDISVCAHV